MGGFFPHGRRNSRVVQPFAPSSFDWPPNLDLPVEHANNSNGNGSPSGSFTGIDPSVHGGSSYRTPSRSFYHRSFNNSLDPANYSSTGVRQETAELASLALNTSHSLPPDTAHFPPSLDTFRQGRHSSENAVTEEDEGTEDGGENAHLVPRVDWQAPERPEADDEFNGSTMLPPTGSSALTQMIRSPVAGSFEDRASVGDGSYDDPRANYYHGDNGGDGCDNDEPGTQRRGTVATVADEPQDCQTEQTALLSKASRGYGTSTADVEGQCVSRNRPRSTPSKTIAEITRYSRLLCSPKSWDRQAIWNNGVVHPASLIPSVFLGLLLNILDALSYGMILFPLGEPIFAGLGTDGISMFYVSTIIAQVVFSSGGSIFAGGIGSEMIEVVPFFHQMAATILLRVGEDNPKSVLATTILAFSVSSILTGLVFFLMGTCGLGSLIGFFPRHILIGCIGGVGFFLMQTGVEVSARLSGSLEFNLPGLEQLIQLDTLPLWTVPLLLAIGLLILQRFIRSNFLVGGYFIGVAVAFYIVKFSARVPMDVLRQQGWVFDAPSSSNPWYHFYTLYDFSAVNWTAFADTIPAMFALTFFGVLHVPINVPALGISTGEDNLNVDRELMAHGVTNALSGFAGSIQNYLVYTNSLLFIDSGGNSRLAGLMLAAATMGILFIGPVIVGFIPVMVVGALIFLLGIELMQEALVDTWGKLHRLEYLTVIIIVLTMGAWDFVSGIVVGIILACVSFVVQTSRKSAIRATFSGKNTGSTVRRPPVQQRYLREAGQQTLIMKLASYLFFGTIVNVENTVRGLIEEEAFKQRPIRFLILDFSRVYGLDFSAAEAFTRINRILRKRNVQTTISGLDVRGDVGRSLQSVGLFGPENGVQIFEDLNSAMEYCENEYLKVFYNYREDFLVSRRGDGDGEGEGEEEEGEQGEEAPPPQPPTRTFLEVPTSSGSISHSPRGGGVGILPSGSSHSSDGFVTGSPRRRYLQQAATETIHEDEIAVAPPAAWSVMRQPLPLLLQTFQGLTTRNEDFWHPACSYFSHESHAAGTILYQEGDEPQGFYLLESGMLRAEYELPQGRYFELIVAGRPCGELPFFSETRRTATVKAEQDCTVWCLRKEQWTKLRDDVPAIAQELLAVSLKLTTERMDSITSYVLTIAA